MPGRSMPSGLTRGSDSLASRRFADSALNRSSGRPCRARTKLRRFVCRLDVCWTAFFFLFLLCVAAITSVVTETIINRHTLATWLTLHQLRISAANSRIEQGTAIVDRMAAAFNDVHLLKPLPMQTEVALELACSTLAAYDKDMVVRAFLAISVGQEEMVGCMHGMADSGSLSTLTGFLSQNHTMDGTYLVDKDTMKFARPLQQMTVAPPDRRSASDMVTYSFQTTRIFELGEAYYNGSIATYDKRECWFYPTATPHLIYYTLPVSIAARNLVLNRNLDDYVQVRIDGSRILLGNAFKRTTGLSIAAFIPQTLDNADPLVLATSWGQESVSNNSMFQSTDFSGVQYLKVSGIDDPLMRAALKHIRLTSLQRSDCNETVIFHFKGACATVTALTLTTNTGFVIRLVFASAHEPLVGPYRTIVNALNGVLGFVILLFTFLFWCFIYTQFTRPLTELAVLMTRNVATGKRTMYVAASTTWMRLKEVDQLIRAHNRAMRRLRQIELFIPAAIRNYFNRPAAQTRYLLTDISDQVSSETEMHTIPLCTLTTQVQTAVYIMLRPAPRPYVPPESLTRLLRSKTTSSVGGMSPNTLAPTTTATTAAVAHSAVSAVSAAVSSGPFSSPAALELFAEAIYELSAQHHGLVYRICPDSCVIHFGKTARTLQSEVDNRAAWREGRKEAVDAQRQQQDIESGIRRDARDAMAFVWRLQDFMNDTQNGVGDVDACTLIDTTTFVCGQYRAKESEHVLSIAMGRDVQRDLGPLLPALKVRVAMTEETARRLRAEWAGTLEPGVRQLPIEAVSTDRAGSNKSVVLLYEALPGSVAGDLVWQRYSQYCFEGFACMLRGDYAAALQAYTRICEISDLEPGLMPVCLEREAAISFVSRGATSVQVDRLMRECRRCVSLHIVRPYCRTRRLPPGMRATLLPRGDGGSAAAEWGARGGSRPASSRPSSVATQPQQPLQRLPPPLTVADGAPSPAIPPPPPPPKPPARRVHFAPRLLMSCEDRQRYLVSSTDTGVAARHVLGDPTKVIRDVFGQKWSLARNFRTATAAHPSNVYVVSLHASGAFCLASQLILRQVPPIVAKAVKNAPDGPLTDALRSAVPVCDPNATQMAQLRAMVNTFCSLSHPSLLLPFSYCTGVEGVVVLLWPFFPGCSLRELLRRHPRLAPVSAAHCTLPILAALSHLHAQKAVHGEVSLDTVVVTSTGECRLLTRCAGNRNAREVFALPQTCYVSPAMAAGALPTPACDMFCYGLMCIEILSGGKVWKWASGAAAAEGQAARSAEELATLLKTGGQSFMEAVANGLLQPDMDVLDAVPTGNLYRELAAATVRACLSPHPARRPTAKQVCAVTKLFVEKDITNESETTPP